MAHEIVEVQPEETQGATLADVLGKDAAEIEVLLAGEEDAAEEPEATEEVVAEVEEEAEEIAAEATEEEPDEETAEQAEEEGEVEPEVEPIALKLSAREDGEDEIIDFDAADDETREGLANVQRRLDEGELLRTQSEGVRQQVFDIAEREAKVELIEDGMAVDPSGFLLEKVTSEVQREVLLDLMLDDKLFEFVTEKIEEWADGRGHRKIDAAERKADRTTRTVVAEQKFREGRENREKSKAIVAAVQELVPDDYPLQEATEFYDEALHVIAQHIKTTGALEPGEVATILERKLKLYGITPATNGKSATRAKSAEETGKRFVARRAKKKAAASAPGGAGVAPTAVGPPKGASLKEALDFADANVKFSKTG